MRFEDTPLDVDSIILSIALLLLAFSTSFFWDNNKIFEALILTCAILILWTLDKIRRELKAIRHSNK